MSDRDDEALEERLAVVAALVREIEELPDEAGREKAREVVAAVLDLHRAALAKILEVAAAEGETGRKVIDAAAADAVVASVLVLHELHPQDLAARVRAALDALRTGLVLRGARAELVALDEAAVRIKIVRETAGCGSDVGRLRGMVEEAIGRAAPDIAEVAVEVVSEPASGLIPVESLKTPWKPEAPRA